MSSEGPIRARRPLNPHVRERLSERNVPEGAVDWVLNHYHSSRSARRSTIYIVVVNGRNLRVYVRTGSNPPRVTTVAWEDER